MNKLEIPYAVKSSPNSYKEIDSSSRTVDLIANTYNYFDSDADVLLMGACAKSIQERGVNSSLPGKIKHLMHHDMTKVVGKPTLLEETTLDGKEVLHANSFFPEVEDSERELQKYIAGLYDQHSIGYRYLNIEWVEKETDAWDKYMKILINPDEADKYGYMYIVKEIELFEYSTVAFGANRLTPYLGSKSENKTVQYQNLMTKLDSLHKAMKETKDKYTIQVQERQVKQMIYELYHPEPDLKATHKEPEEKFTQVDLNKYLQTIKIIK